ncbi:hypothetical protein, conserved [Leishmania tarentolae]|uniref:BRCT domain-containing protein n=1 Tax=Leishmania tarentolae TaxID=5689 RepID=A0A640KL74_LEITA|nr:hypothetical protein, conserved [Leishmania tarentolae]
MRSMEVPATRPEVTTTGIYGEELNIVRQHLLRSELCWCGDLTSRTQVLVVGSSLCAASRKLSVARMRGLPCVSIEWVTEGACAMESTYRYDIGNGLTGKEVCTTSLTHLERGRVQAVCSGRGATYSSMLTRHCGLLVASAAALSLTLSSSSPPTIANEKVRFARKHGIPIIAVEEFVLHYATESLYRHHLPPEDSAPVRVAHDASLLWASSPGSRTSNGNAYTDVACEPKRKTGCSSTGASADSLSSSNDNRVSVCGPLRPSAQPVRSATPTLRSSAANCTCSITSVRGPRRTEGMWRGCDSIIPSAVQPSLSSSQFVPTASTAACASPSGRSRRLLTDEFSDVVAYCSPLHRFTTQQHDLLSGMGVTVSPQLTPFTTHVLVLGDSVEECLYPRPGLQVVSWKWVTQCRLEQRRLSCLGFRVECVFCPVVTFTGLAAADRHALLSALQQSGLPGKVQEALVLGGSSDERYGNASRPPQNPMSNLYLPCGTTHLVVPRDKLLSSQKVAVLAQRHYQYSSRPQPHPSAPLTSSLMCRLVEVDWVYRSIQQVQWLDADLFTLAIPSPDAFALARKVRADSAGTAGPHSSQTSQEGLPVRLRISKPPSLSPTATNFPMQTPALHHPLSTPFRCPCPHGAIECGSERGLEKLPAGGTVEDGEEEEAASSQHHNTDVGHSKDTASPTSHPRARDDDDEGAGGEFPLTAAVVQSAPQEIQSTSPRLSSPPLRPARSPSANGKQESNAPCTREDLAVTLHHIADSPLSYAYLTTQCTPGFENLLGELEAGPPATPFGASSMHAPLHPYLQACTTENVSVVSVPSGSDREGQIQGGGLYSDTPLAAGADLCVEQRALLRRTSAQPRMLQQQQLLSRTMSDESQVVFYQMGLEEDDGTTAVLPATMNVNPCTITEAVEEKRTVKAAMSPTSCVAGAITNVYPRSASTAAVFLITKDASRSDFDTFASHCPHVRRTSKPEECSHFITAKPSKTEQFLCCLAAGRWILTPAYVTACAQAGYLVSEEPFEWSAEVATSLGYRSSVASLARGCRLQRKAPQLPFAWWRVRVCCTSSARTTSFLRVLRSGGCTSLDGATAAEVLAASNERGNAPLSPNELVLADDTVFSERELEEIASRSTSIASPIMRLEYLVQFLCSSDAPLSEMSLLNSVRSRKRSRTEAAANK